MGGGLKNTFRQALQWLHLDLTTNLKYDRLTRKIIKKTVRPYMNCVDVGCHKGEILDLLLSANQFGLHWAFEPIPEFAERLKQKYAGRALVHDSALSDESGTTTFNYVRNAPAYSGILKRDYATKNPDVEVLTVEKCRMDDVIPEGEKIGFIKIDVEGGEFAVLRGAERLISANRPIVLFECGLGASEHYGTLPQAVYDYFADKKMGIWLLTDFPEKKRNLSKAQFAEHYFKNDEYYFVAGPI